VFGWDLPHGPFEYPDGCKVFAVSMGESMHHEWEWEPFLSYRRQWQPETEQGRAAASNSIAGGPRWRGSAGCRGRKPGSGFSAGAAKSESVTFAANGGEHPVEMARGPASEPAKAQIDETTRARLLDAAEKLFAECGFEGTSVRAINAEADVNSGAIHYYFRTKEDLFRAVIKRRAEILSSDRLTRLARCAEGPGTPSMLEQIIAAYILPYTNPKLGAPEQRLRFARLRARLMAEQQDADPSPLGAEHKFTGQRFVDALVATLPHLSQHEVRVRYMIMWSSLNTLSAGLGHAALDPAGPEKGHALQEFERIVPELVQLFAAMFREAIGLAPIQPGAARVGKKGTGRAAGVR